MSAPTSASHHPIRRHGRARDRPHPASPRKHQPEPPLQRPPPGIPQAPRHLRRPAQRPRILEKPRRRQSLPHPHHRRQSPLTPRPAPTHLHPRHPRPHPPLTHQAPPNQTPPQHNGQTQHESVQQADRVERKGRHHRVSVVERIDDLLIVCTNIYVNHKNSCRRKFSLYQAPDRVGCARASHHPSGERAHRAVETRYPSPQTGPPSLSIRSTTKWTTAKPASQSSEWRKALSPAP